MAQGRRLTADMATFMFKFPDGFTFYVKQGEVFREVHAEVGDKLAPNGIPLAQEIEGWSELCGIGEEYITDSFIVECVE